MRKFFLYLLLFTGGLFHCFAQKPFTLRQNGKQETFTVEQFKPYIYSMMRSRVKTINEQIPIRIDELTTMTLVMLNGSALNYCYQVDFDRSDLTKSETNELIEAIKDACKENIKFLYQSESSKMPASEWKRLFTELGIYYVYTYFDCNNKAFARFTLYPKDIDLDSE